MTALGETPREPPWFSAVRTVLFVVDRVNSRPGSGGHFSLNDVRFSSTAASPEVIPRCSNRDEFVSQQLRQTEHTKTRS